MAAFAKRWRRDEGKMQEGDTLFECGVGRLPVVATLEDLDEPLKLILTQPKNVKQYQRDGVDRPHAGGGGAGRPRRARSRRTLRAITEPSVDSDASRQLRDFPDMRDCGACSRRLGQ
jgi:hypothetical protein